MSKRQLLLLCVIYWKSSFLGIILFADNIEFKISGVLQFDFYGRTETTFRFSASKGPKSALLPFLGNFLL